VELKTIPALFLILILLFLPCPVIAGVEEARKSDTLTLYLENDVFAYENNDRYYTHGTKISWISPDLSDYRDVAAIPLWLHRIIGRMPIVNEPHEQRSVSLSLMQAIYTPENLLRSDLIVNERPYAGLTYLGFALHSK